MRRVVLQSSERDDGETPQAYTNDLRHHDMHRFPISSVGLADICLQPTQRTVEPEWGTMHLIEGFQGAAGTGSSIGAGNVVSYFPPASMPITSIVHATTAPAELGGGSAIALTGSFSEHFDIVKTLTTWSEVIGSTIYLHGVNGKVPLELKVGEVLGNNTTTIWISNAPGTAASVWALVSTISDPAGYIVWDRLPTPDSVAHAATLLVQGPTTGTVLPSAFKVIWDEAKSKFYVSMSQTATITGTDDLLAYTGFQRSDPVSVWMGVDGITHPDYPAWVEPTLGAARVQIAPGNYETAAELSTEISRALASATLPSGLSIGIRAGTVGGWTTVAIRSGTYASPADFYSVLEADITAAGFAVAVFGSATALGPTIMFDTGIHQIDWSSSPGFGHTGMSTGMTHTVNTVLRPGAFGLANAYSVVLDDDKISLVAALKDPVVVEDVVSSSANLFAMATAGPHSYTVGDMVQLSWSGGSTFGVVHLVGGPTTLSLLLSGGTSYPGVPGSPADAESVSADLNPVVSVYSGLRSALRPKLSGFTGFITYGSMSINSAGDDKTAGPIVTATSSMNLMDSGFVLVDLTINGTKIAGATSHYVSTATKSRLMRPLARIKLPRSAVSVVDLDHRHFADISATLTGGATHIKVEFFNEDHTPYATHGVDNSLTLSLFPKDIEPSELMPHGGDLFGSGLVPRIAHW